MDRTLPLLLAESGATDAFKADVRAYAGHESAPRIATARHLPRVKVLRVLAQLLEREPALAVDRVLVDGVSGCADLRGVLTVGTRDGVRAFEFVWDCHWRAREEGWVDCFGLPDQIRAAREFGHRCFERWEAIAVDPAEHTLRAG
jgi:hypothetical protein